MYKTIDDREIIWHLLKQYISITSRLNHLFMVSISLFICNVNTVIIEQRLL